jgi:RNA polymerase sigma-70 factor (sigma-E family)
VRLKRDESEFEEFVRTRRAALLRSARNLTAGDEHLAEDLVQSTIVRIYLAWGRVKDRDRVDAYARRVLLNCFLDHRRRPFVSRERTTDAIPDLEATSRTGVIDHELLAALQTIPPRMRAALVLRHVEDLSVEETATLLGCSVGTVKSQTARGLQKLRQALSASPNKTHSEI